MVAGLGGLALVVAWFVGSLITSAVKNAVAKSKERRQQLKKSWNEAIRERKLSLHIRKIGSDGVLPIIGCREFKGC